jgi:hypothetical protein
MRASLILLLAWLHDVVSINTILGLAISLPATGSPAVTKTPGD